jgi:hypothetical protein
VSTSRLTPDGERVVYRADQDAPLLFELFSAPADASAAPVQVHPPLVAGGTVFDGFVVLADRVLYRSDAEVSGQVSLYATPLPAGTPLRLNEPSAGNVDRFRSVGTWVLYTAFLDQFLFSVPLAGGVPPVELSESVPALKRIHGFSATADGSTVAFLAELDPAGTIELFSVPMTGGPATKLNAPLAPFGHVLDFAFLPGASLMYLAPPVSASASELFRVSLAGGPVTPLNPALVPGGSVLEFWVTADGARILYRADQDVDERVELYSVPSDASAAPVRLNQTLQSAGDVLSFVSSPGGTHAVFRADAAQDERIELFAVPTDGSALPVVLNGPLGPNNDVTGPVAVLPDERTVLYVGDEVVNTENELRRASLDGSVPSRRESGDLVPNGRVTSFASAGNVVVYRADQDEDDVFELYLSFLTPPVRRR